MKGAHRLKYVGLFSLFCLVFFFEGVSSIRLPLLVQNSLEYIKKNTSVKSKDVLSYTYSTLIRPFNYQSVVALSSQSDVAPSEILYSPNVRTVFSGDAIKFLPKLGDSNYVSINTRTPDQGPWSSGTARKADLPNQEGPRESSLETSTSSTPRRPVPVSDEQSNDDLDLNFAHRMGTLASIAYCSVPSLIQSWGCTRCAAVPGFEVFAVYWDDVWDLSAFVGYDAASGSVVTSFRGTDSSNWGNWAENMKSWRINQMYPVAGNPQAMIHSGFWTLWSQFKPNVTAAIAAALEEHPGAALTAVGHSMGGAIAQLCALDMKFTFNLTDVRSYTYGAPRVGNWAYAQLYAQFMSTSWRFTHNRDVVPSVPLQMMGFHHVAREAWVVDVASHDGTYVNEKVLMCDDSGEDPSCHDSACLLGICTSVADHLFYLGIHMYSDDTEC